MSQLSNSARNRELKQFFYVSFQERKTATPIRRQSINQISSPNASTVVYRPSPTQSPATLSAIGPVGNEFNTTLVGSNNISLNKVCVLVTFYEINGARRVMANGIDWNYF